MSTTWGSGVPEPGGERDEEARVDAAMNEMLDATVEGQAPRLWDGNARSEPWEAEAVRRAELMQGVADEIGRPIASPDFAERVLVRVNRDGARTSIRRRRREVSPLLWAFAAGVVVTTSLALLTRIKAPAPLPESGSAPAVSAARAPAEAGAHLAPALRLGDAGKYDSIRWGSGVTVPPGAGSWTSAGAPETRQQSARVSLMAGVRASTDFAGRPPQDAVSPLIALPRAGVFLGVERDASRLGTDRAASTPGPVFSASPSEPRR